MKKIILSFLFLILNSVNICGGRPFSPNYDPDNYQTSGAGVGMIMALMGMRFLCSPIHKKLRMSPHTNPGTRIMLVGGYCIAVGMGASLGGHIADECEDGQLTELEQIQKYGLRMKNRTIEAVKKECGRSF